MQDFVSNYYLIIKALHLISLISWMAGMLYLPRLFVYHAEKPAGSDASNMLKVMEYRLQKFIMLPAMLATFLFGGLLAMQPGIMEGGWLHMKLFLVLALAGFHGACARWRKDFAADQNTKNAKFFRIVNEVPTILMIGIIWLAVVKPF